jgi:hypothetical protein
MVSSLYLGKSKEGGTSRVGSAWRVHNELAATRPDLVRTLAEGWVGDR